MQRILALVVLAVLATAGGPRARGAEPAAPPHRGPRQGPLARLPSRPGPHVEKIRALGDNEWLALGPPAPDPKWGKARGRSWSSNMPFAPDLRGGFVFGEGVHGYVKPNGHYMNDLWFYDANSHRWVCLYPGIEVKSLARKIKDGALTVDDRGLLVDKDGQPLPPLLIHAYGYLGYNPDRHRFAFFGSQLGNYFTTGKGGVFEEANRLFQKARQGRKFPSLSPFFYDTTSGKIDCFPVARAPQGRPFGANLLVYVGSKKQFFYGGSDGVWFLDPQKRTWVDARPKGTPPTGIDRCAAYDSKRDRIYHHGKGDRTNADSFLVYDVKGNAWSRPSPTGPGPAYSSSYESIFHYDAAADALVVIRLYTTKDAPGLRRGIYVYDPKTNAWADPLPLPAGVVKSIRNGNFGFHDPELNVSFCYFAGDSNDDGTLWVYRYKKPAAQK